MSLGTTMRPAKMHESHGGERCTGWRPAVTVAFAASFIWFTAIPCEWAIAQPAQSNRDQLPMSGVDADPEIPDSRAVLRYDWGEEISNHQQIELYLNRLHDAAPGRTRMVEYGQSWEGRSLNYLVISSPENLERLDDIRQKNLQLSDPRSITPADAQTLINSQPVVVWLAYCVHGNEATPSDAAMLTAYHLLADRRDATKELLKNCVVVIDPLQNPDGRDRFVSSFREARGRYLQADPFANEHAERWPGGRANHYWFDMNRDWFLQSQQEVRAKVAAYLEWQPQIYVDAHEMGRNSTFYFPPPAEPKNPFLLPEQEAWFGKLGRHHASWFDRFGLGYMTREVFDAFYPGYGSEWPTMQGGLGILWEQAGARGLEIERDDETILTYRDGVRNHYLSGLATLEFAANNRAELLQSFYHTKLQSIELGRSGDVQHYFFSPDPDPHRTRGFCEMLQRNGIEVDVLASAVEVECEDLHDGTVRHRTMNPGTIHVAVAQPTARLIRSLCDRSVEMDPRFLRRQLERNEMGLPDEIYDVTAWSMPMAFGVRGWSTRENPTIQTVPWASREGSSDEESLPDVGDPAVAWLIPGTDGAMQALSDWLQSGLRVHVNDEPFVLNGRTFDRGTLIVKVSENDQHAKEQVQRAARDHGIQPIPTDTAFVDRGAHFGGSHVRWVRSPKVLMVVNEPAASSCGHTWFLMDQVLKYPVTRVNGAQFGRADWDKYNVIVLPSGSYGESNGFGKKLAERLNQWIADGGTLVALGSATRWTSGDGHGLIKNTILKRKVDRVIKEGDTTRVDEGNEIETSPDRVPGAFFNCDVFDKHWVTFGFGKSLSVFYSGNLVLSPTQKTDGRTLVSFQKRDRLLASGFCWPANLDLMAETPYVVYRRVGRGHVVSFVDDPNYRAMYPSLQRLFINAIMFGPAH